MILRFMLSEEIKTFLRDIARLRGFPSWLRECQPGGQGVIVRGKIITLLFLRREEFQEVHVFAIQRHFYLIDISVLECDQNLRISTG